MERTAIYSVVLIYLFFVCRHLFFLPPQLSACRLWSSLISTDVCRYVRLSPVFSEWKNVSGAGGGERICVTLRTQTAVKSRLRFRIREQRHSEHSGALIETTGTQKLEQQKKNEKNPNKVNEKKGSPAEVSGKVDGRCRHANEHANEASSPSRTDRNGPAGSTRRNKRATILTSQFRMVIELIFAIASLSRAALNNLRPVLVRCGLILIGICFSCSCFFFSAAPASECGAPSIDGPRRRSLLLFVFIVFFSLESSSGVELRRRTSKRSR